MDKGNQHASLIILFEVRGLTPQRVVCGLRVGFRPITCTGGIYWGDMAGVEINQYGDVISSGESQTSWRRGGQIDKRARCGDKSQMSTRLAWRSSSCRVVAHQESCHIFSKAASFSTLKTIRHLNKPEHMQHRDSQQI